MLIYIKLIINHGMMGSDWSLNVALFHALRTDWGI